METKTKQKPKVESLRVESLVCKVDSMSSQIKLNTFLCLSYKMAHKVLKNGTQCVSVLLQGYLGLNFW